MAVDIFKLVYVLLAVSLILNFLLSLKVFELNGRINKVENRVELSEEEVKQITMRLTRLKEMDRD
jgi:hypothetical protein